MKMCSSVKYTSCTDDDDVGGVDVERNADVALPLPSRCIDSSAMLDIFNIDYRC